MAARYVESLGGKPQATVIGTSILTSSVNAALANGMAAHADETDDSHCAAVPIPAASHRAGGAGDCGIAGCSGTDLMPAVVLGYDIAPRVNSALGFCKLGPTPQYPLPGTFGSDRGGSRMVRLDPSGCAGLLLCGRAGLGCALLAPRPRTCREGFDFGGMAPAMASAGDDGRVGLHRRRRRLGGAKNFFTAIGSEKPVPGELTAKVGSRFEIMNTQSRNGSPATVQSVLDGVTVLPEDRGRARRQDRGIIVEASRTRYNRQQSRHPGHLPAAPRRYDDRGRRRDVRQHSRRRPHERPQGAGVVRKLVEAVPNQELVTAVPARQSIVKIETTDGRTLSHRTYEVRGTPGNPMEADEVSAKALDLMAPILGADRANELIAAIDKFDGSRSGVRTAGGCCRSSLDFGHTSRGWPLWR